MPKPASANVPPNQPVDPLDGMPGDDENVAAPVTATAAPATTSEPAANAPATETAAAPQEPEAVESAPDELDDEDIAIARDLGITDEQIEEAGPSAADLIVARLDSKIAEVGRQILAERNGAAPKPEQQAAPKPKPAPKKELPLPVESDAGDDEEFELPREFLEGGYDPALVEAVTRLRNHYSAQNKALREQLGAMGERIERFDSVAEHFTQAQARDNERKFDSLVAGLGEEAESLFGKGPTRKLDPNSIHHKNRVKLAETMAGIVAGDLRFGNEPREEDALILAAARAEFPEYLKQQITKDMASKMAARRGAVVPRGVAGKTGNRDANSGRFAVTTPRSPLDDMPD